jgi:hypothetical protein
VIELQESGKFSFFLQNTFSLFDVTVLGFTFHLWIGKSQQHAITHRWSSVYIIMYLPTTQNVAFSDLWRTGALSVLSPRCCTLR